MDQKGMDHKRMDQKLLQEKILSDPSIVTSMESEVIAAAESDPQMSEFVACVSETEVAMKEALLSIPVPGNLKSKLLALPEVDEIEAADSSSGAKLGLTLDRSLALAKRFRVALIMAAMFAAAAGLSLLLPGS